MKNVIIIGAGGHAAELDEYIKYANKINDSAELNVVGFIDDDPLNYLRYKFSAPLLGGIKEHVVRIDIHYLIGIANLKYRRLFVDRFISEGAAFTSFVHPTAMIAGSSAIGEGSIICPNASLGPNVKIGNYSLINSRCSVGHDTEVGDYNFISPNVCFSGFTTVGDENLFGINAATIPGIKVGNRNKIAAGMVLDQNVGDDEVVFYRYKEKVIAVPRKG